MPLSRRVVMFCGLLLIAIPVQYCINELVKNEDPEKALCEKIENIFKRVEDIFDSILLFKARAEYRMFSFIIIRDWAKGWKKEQTKPEEGKTEPDVILKMKTRSQNVDWNMNRPPENVLFRIGDVVLFKHEGHKGVIIAWKLEHNEKDAQYTVLLDYDKKSSIVSGIYGHDLIKHYDPIRSKFLHLYFQGFNGYKFVPQRWLQNRFPQD